MGRERGGPGCVTISVSNFGVFLKRERGGGEARSSIWSYSLSRSFSLDERDGLAVFTIFVRSQNHLSGRGGETEWIGSRFSFSSRRREREGRHAHLLGYVSVSVSNFGVSLPPRDKRRSQVSLVDYFTLCLGSGGSHQRRRTSSLFSLSIIDLGNHLPRREGNRQIFSYSSGPDRLLGYASLSASKSWSVFLREETASLSVTDSETFLPGDMGCSEVNFF